MHRILFYLPPFHLGAHRFDGFAIYTYGVMLGIAFLVGLWIASVRAGKMGISPERIGNLALLLLAGGVIGSRLLFVAESRQDYLRRPLEIFNLRQGGLSIHGGLILGFLAGWWYIRKTKLPFWKTADLLAPAIAVGLGIGRIGCFFNGCCFGISTRLPWGVAFNDAGILGRRHPTQLYEMLLDFLIAGFVAYLSRRTEAGVSFLWLCILVGVERFFMEYLRADAIWAGHFSVAQWISAAFVLTAGIVLVRRQFRQEGSLSRSLCS